MKLNSISYINNINYRYISTNKGRSTIKEEGEYVMLPKKKYKRDQLIEKCFEGSLIAIALIKIIFDRPKIP